MKVPVDNLLSNWAYMVMAALAWNLKAWAPLLLAGLFRCGYTGATPERQHGPQDSIALQEG